MRELCFAMKKIVLLRHGESVWNNEGRITGWTDIGLSDKGRDEACRAGRLLRLGGIRADVAFVSMLVRAEDTLDILLSGLDYRPEIHRSWRLNERHFGLLQGMTYGEIASHYGEERYKSMVYGYDTPVPQMPLSDRRHPANSARYASVSPGLLPGGESFHDMVLRVRGVWEEDIMPALAGCSAVLVVSHGNVLGGILRLVKGLSDDTAASFILPNAAPLVLEFDDSLHFARDYMLDCNDTLCR